MEKDEVSVNKECKKYILQIVASLCLCDHIGDVMGDIGKILEDIEFDDDDEWYELHELLDILAKRDVTTLFGTELGDE